MPQITNIEEYTNPLYYLEPRGAQKPRAATAYIEVVETCIDFFNRYEADTTLSQEQQDKLAAIEAGLNELKSLNGKDPTTAQERSQLAAQAAAIVTNLDRFVEKPSVKTTRRPSFKEAAVKATGAAGQVIKGAAVLAKGAAGQAKEAVVKRAPSLKKKPFEFKLGDGLTAQGSSDTTATSEAGSEHPEYDRGSVVPKNAPPLPPGKPSPEEAIIKRLIAAKKRFVNVDGRPNSNSIDSDNSDEDDYENDSGLKKPPPPVPRAGSQAVADSTVAAKNRMLERDGTPQAEAKPPVPPRPQTRQAPPRPVVAPQQAARTRQAPPPPPPPRQPPAQQAAPTRRVPPPRPPVPAQESQAAATTKPVPPPPPPRKQNDGEPGSVKDRIRRIEGNKPADPPRPRPGGNKG